MPTSQIEPDTSYYQSWWGGLASNDIANYFSISTDESDYALGFMSKEYTSTLIAAIWEGTEYDLSDKQWDEQVNIGYSPSLSWGGYGSKEALDTALAASKALRTGVDNKDGSYTDANGNTKGQNKGLGTFSGFGVGMAIGAALGPVGSLIGGIIGAVVGYGVDEAAGTPPSVKDYSQKETWGKDPDDPANGGAGKPIVLDLGGAEILISKLKEQVFKGHKVKTIGPDENGKTAIIEL